MANSFWAQADMASRLMDLQGRLSRLAADRPSMLVLKNEPERRGRDLPTYIVARVLKIDFYDVDPMERSVAKQALFGYFYMKPFAEIQDALMVERRV